MEEIFALRALKITDAPLMLEWMHDESVTENLRSNFSDKTIEECHHFIEQSQNSYSDLHLAIVNQYDEYLGTVSLKNIIINSAEFAITIRKKAMGTGCSIFAMQKMIEKGLNEFKLHEVYWCVSPANIRALRFYDKNGYKRVDFSRLLINVCNSLLTYSEQERKEYVWYHVFK